jgi:hypothetical protein
MGIGDKERRLSFGAEGELKMLDDVIKYCEEEKERVKQIWKLGGMTQ